MSRLIKALLLSSLIYLIPSNGCATNRSLAEESTLQLPSISTAELLTLPQYQLQVKATVLIAVSKNRIGSGVLISATPGKPAVILSAAHLFTDQLTGEPLTDVSILISPRGLSDNLIIPVQLVALDSSKDIALLITTLSWELEKIEIELDDTNLKRGEKVSVISFPLGNGPRLADGLVSDGVDRLGNGFYILTVPIYYGSSGGGVWQGDRLVGIISGMQVAESSGRTLVPGATLAVDSESIAQFLSNL